MTSQVAIRFRHHVLLFSNFQYTRSMGVLISFTMISAVLGDLLLPVLLLVVKPLAGGIRRRGPDETFSPLTQTH